MRYAIVSDIHANLSAWQNTLTDLTDLGAEEIICLGDVVGYGPEPVEVLESVYQVAKVVLMGNHDAAVCGRLAYNHFTPRAQRAVTRHRQLLSGKALNWMAELPLSWSCAHFACAHGDHSRPELFHYVAEPQSALPSWQATAAQLLFVGHSHLPGIYVIGQSGTPHFVEPCDFELEEGKRYLVNPGSVGYPRIGDIRTSYCIYDSAAHTITFRQLPFDSQGYSRLMRRLGEADDPWFAEKAMQSAVALRNVPDFKKPPPKVGLGARLRRHLARQLTHERRWPLFAAALLLLLSGITCSAFRLGHSRAEPTELALSVPPYDLPRLTAYPLLPPERNLLPPLPAVLSPNERLEGWRYHFEDRLRKRFYTGLRDGNATLCIANEGRRRAQLESPLIDLAGADLRRVRLKCRVRKHADFNGQAQVQLVTYRSSESGQPQQHTVHPFELRSSRFKLQPPAAERNLALDLALMVTHIRLRIDADFSGTLEIEEPTLQAANKKGE